MVCKHCGIEIDDSSAFCSHCGYRTSFEVAHDGPICPKCSSHNISTQAIPNNTRRNIVRFIILVATFVMPFMSTSGETADNGLVLLLSAFISTSIVSLVLKIVFKFLPIRYDTLFICERCGKNWKK